MQDIVIQIANVIKVSTYDVYLLTALLIIFIIFCILWINKMFEVMAWIVLWISVFIVFQYLLLNPNLTVPTFIDHKVGKFIVWTSVYLIFILSILIPVNWSFHIKDPKNIWIKIAYTLWISWLVMLTFLAIIVWFIEKIYIYNIDNAFQLLTVKLTSWWEFSAKSIVYWFLKTNVPTITLFSVFFIIYMITFNDLVILILKSSWEVLSKIWKWGWGWGWWGGHDDTWHHH